MSDIETPPARAPKKARLPWGTVVRWVLLAGVLGAIVYARFLSPQRVEAHRVGRGEVVAEVFGRGTIESDREAQLGFDLVGRLSSVLVDEGTRVTLGQELARLVTDQVQADLRAATSGVAAARSSLVRLAAEETRARNALDAATREERRAQGLSATGSIPTHDLDVAADQLRAARSELDRILASRMEATRSIDVAAGGAEMRRVTALRASLLAPFDGLITRRLREPGDTVNVGTTVLRLVDTEHVYVRAWIDETVIGQVHEAQSARITFPGGDVPASATVSRVGWESDRQTHELLVDVVPGDLARRVSVGQRADVWITTGQHTGVIRIPTRWIRRDVQGTFCWVDRGGRVAMARVSLGLSGRDVVEIVRGLREGDTVLSPVQPGGSLTEGRRWRS